MTEEATRPEPAPDAVDADREVLPYGSWPSPIRVDDLLVDTVRLGETWIDGEDVLWTEGRPSEGGRTVLVRRGGDGTTVELTPPPFDCRSRVHEYGGGSFTAAGGIVVFSNRVDDRLYRLDPGVVDPVAITPEGPYRYGDLRLDAGRRRFIAIRETHHAEPGREPTSAIVAVPLDGDAPPVVLYSGPDFLTSPRPSPDGSMLAWVEWDHPDMPWDATRLRVAPVAQDGSLGRAELTAGGPDESIVQPEWSPDGLLHFVSDRTGWWNLYRLSAGPRLEPLAAMEAEFADPPWTLDRSTYAFLGDGSLIAAGRRAGQDHLIHVDPARLIGEIEGPYTELVSLRSSGTLVVAAAASPTEPTVIATFDPLTLAPSGVLRRSTPVNLDPGWLAIPESITFPTPDGGEAHALLYRPTAPTVTGPADERPPLVVRSHGGPTANAGASLDLDVQFFTSRGIAVVDVDYRGSTGYGRAYRDALRGRWGELDVDDCVAAARFLAARGDVDPDRMAIEGGSAGGFTTLAALAFRDTFAAGISLFGIADLEALARDTHKFEARYLDRLVGPYPAQADRYRQRSPVHFFDEVSCPVLVIQGLEDRVVPPAQAEAIVAALAANGIPHAYLALEGEGHGFRGATALRASIESRLAFLGAVFGFTPADVPPLQLPGIEAWRAARAAATAATAVPSAPAPGSTVPAG